MTSGRFARRLRVYYSSAVSFDSRRGAPPEGFQARRCQKSARSFRLPRKMLSSAFSDVGNTYGVSRTRQAAFTVPAVLPHSPVIPRRRCTRLFRIICNPEPAIGECLSLCRSYSRAIQNLRRDGIRPNKYRDIHRCVNECVRQTRRLGRRASFLRDNDHFFRNRVRAGHLS